jgi:hypothetical protein
MRLCTLLYWLSDVGRPPAFVTVATSIAMKRVYIRTVRPTSEITSIVHQQEGLLTNIETFVLSVTSLIVNNLNIHNK